MEEKFTVKTEFTLKKRIDIIRAFMGRAYYGFILVAAAVLCYNFYLLNTGKAAPGDDKKTAALFAVMLLWALIPVVSGFIWDKASKVKSAVISVYDDKLVFTSENAAFELLPDRFYGITEREDYIKLGPLKQTVIIDTKDVTKGSADEIAKFLRDMLI